MKKSDSLSVVQEGLLSSIDIQDWNLKTYRKEIYENIGQLLSLAKMQIASVNTNENVDTINIVNSFDKILSRVIKDLRNLSRQLSPEEILQKGVTKSLMYELERLEKLGLCKTNFLVSGKQFHLQTERELILFSILQHYIFTALFFENARNLKVTISFEKELIKISIYYAGNNDLNTGIISKKGMGIRKRLKLICATVRITSTSKEKVILIRVKKPVHDQFSTC